MVGLPTEGVSLWRRLSGAWHYGLALALGVGLFSHMYTWDFLLGRSAFFAAGDISQAVAGWWMYAHDTLRFPLLKTEYLMWPEGESVVFTDSIPVMALIFKPFVAWLPEHFHYFGIWHFLVYLSQAASAVFLARSLKAPKWAAVVAAFFALIFPALTWRIGHSSLMMHALILMALGVYLRARSGALSIAASHRLFFLLQALSLLVHAYFFPMVYALWVAMMIDAWDANGGWRGFLKYAGAQLLGTVMVFVGLGYLRGGSETVGFGIYSTNLLAPFVGGRFTPPFIDATTGQGEGFNYLGVGILGLLPFALVYSAGEIGASLRRHRALVLVLGLMAVYSFSNHIYAGNTQVAEWPGWLNVKKLTHTFRASGRFFWPLGYAVMFLVLAQISRRVRLRHAIPLLALGMILQWQDLAALRANTRRAIAMPGTLAPDPISPVLADAKILGCSPCVIGNTEEGNKFVLHMHWLAGFHGLKISGGYVARGNLAKPEVGDAADVYLLSPTLVESRRGEISEYAKALLQAGAFRRMGDLLVCRRDWTDAQWAQTAPSAEKYDYLAHWPSLASGQSATHADAHLEFTTGWSEPEPTLRWSSGKLAVVHFKLDAPATSARTLALTFSMLDRQQVVVKLNGHVLHSGPVAPNTEGRFDRLSLKIPPDALLVGLNKLEFELPEAHPPGTADSRVLSYAFRSMTLQ